MRFAPLAAALLLAGCATVATTSTQPLGTKPTYLQAFSTEVPNRAALSGHIFTPALDENWVPQGLTVAGPYLLVSSYLPTPELKNNTGPCRVFRIEKATGKAAGHFDFPVGTCTHSGGLAYLGNNKLYLADTRQLFHVDLERAFATGKADGAFKGVKITGLLRGSYGAFDGKDYWVGTWTKEQPKALMFRLEPGFFDKYDGQTVKEDRAVESIPVPLEAQGAAFDRAGNLWVTASGPKFGRLYRLDRKGVVQAQYEMVPGLENVAVDDDGSLWALSESGTRKYMHWDTHYPYIFRIDVSKLK